MPESEVAIILKTEATGESFLKLHLLSAQSGIFLCLKRVSKKASNATTPDLFDQADVLLESSQQGTMRFVKEYTLLQRREPIGLNYRSLQYASRLSQLLVRNASHMPESDVLFELTSRALDAFAEGKAPEIVLFKSLYLLLKDEGYPVREDWWPSLRPAFREQAKVILQQPSPKTISSEQRTLCIQLEEQLIRWMRHHTDLIVPD